MLKNTLSKLKTAEFLSIICKQPKTTFKIEPLYFIGVKYAKDRSEIEITVECSHVFISFTPTASTKCSRKTVYFTRFTH